jgi:hypothetical protein
MTMSYIKSILVILLFSQVGYGQANTAIRNAESLLRLTDTVVRKEIASFSVKGASLEKADTSPGMEMRAFRLMRSNDSMAYFNDKNHYIYIYSSRFKATLRKLSYAKEPASRLLLIDNKPFWGTDGQIPAVQIDTLFVVLHSHFLVKIPASALVGIYEPNFISYRRPKRKKKAAKIPVPSHYKILQSADRRRIYIYMVNGTNAGKYEVTWAIVDGKYYTRVVDPILGS